jgi:hypothetical protein
VAVLGRLLISSGERLDLPDLLSLDSYTAGDFKYLLKGLVGDSKPFILKGFEVIDPNNAIGTQSCSIRVAESVVFYPGSSTGSFFHGLQEGHPRALPLVPELRKNAVNYVYLTFSTFNTSTDTRAFWDPDKDGGAGGEFTQDVNTESVLQVEVNVSVGSFPENTIPIAKVTVGPVVITAIEDARDMLFRLGSGGITPNPFNAYSWRSLPSSTYQRTEPPTKMLAGGINPFQGADKNIFTLKEWMDTVMTKLRELGGTVYWYEDTSTYSLISNFLDSVATAFKSKGAWLHDSSTPGLLTWTEDVNIKIASDPRTYIVRSGNKTLADEQVLYIPMVRKQPFNVTDEQVDWISGQSYINTIGGAVGLFANLSKGDYVKKINDSNDKYLRVEEFYDSISLGGSVTSAANAKSVRLSGNYLGSTLSEKGRYDKGVYQPADLIVSDRNQAAISNIGGNFHWMAMRSDTIQSVASIVTSSLLLDIEEHDGSTAKVTSALAHNLIDGDRIEIVGSTNFDGIYAVEVEDSTTFYINITGGPNADELGVSAYFATVTTAARSTPYSLQLESANHNFRTNESIIVAGTVGFNGSYPISVRSSTSFTIPVSSAIATESVGTATLARTIVRTEGAVAQIVQGQSANIGGDPAENIRQYVGMQSMSETYPSYSVSPSYNTIDGFVNYNSQANENLTARVSKLTAMMADKAQDKTIKLLPSDYQSISNATNGIYQDINFITIATGGFAKLDVIMPGSDFNGDIALDSLLLSIPANKVVYFTVDRNASFSLALNTLSMADLDKVPLDENVFVFAVRLSGGEVWLWDGTLLKPDFLTPVHDLQTTVVRQNLTVKLTEGGNWYWDALNGTLINTSFAYVLIPSLNKASNTIASGSYNLAADGDFLYVQLNRFAASPVTLSVVNSSMPDAVLFDSSDDVFVIARRVGDSVIVGDSMLLNHGDTKALDYDERVVRVRVIDNVSASLPSGVSVTVDGISLNDGDKVLFTKVGSSEIHAVSNIGVGATWTQIKAFDSVGSIPDGCIVFSEEGTSGYNTLWTKINGVWKQLEHGEVQGEPTGFPNRSDSYITFTDATRELTITPTATEFDVYQKGIPYRFDTAQTIVIPDVEGLHYVYFNNGALATTQAFTIDIIKEYAFTATVQWDATNNQGILVGDERHGLTMDGETHAYLHQSLGTRHISGLSAGGFTTSGTGNANTDAQLSISNGRIRDEDISIDIVDAAVPSAEFEQILDPIAEIPVYYRDGVSGDWRKDTATQYPVKAGTGVIKYNDPAGPWTTPDATSGNFVAMWVFATNSITEPVIAILGQRQDATLNDAQANNTYESLLFGSLPSLEMKVLYRLIFETSSTFTNAVGAALRDVRDLRRAIDVSLGAYAPSDHGLLSGLTDQDHPDYAIFVNDPTTYVGGLRQISITDNDDVEKALNSLDRFFAQLRMRPHPSNTNRVILSGADQALTNSITLSQVIKGLMMSFNGAQIDFSTGSIYASDGVTPLGINFTPATIAAGQYRWYSVNLVGISPNNANNTVSARVKIVTAAADGATPSAAPRAKYASGGVKIGQVWVQESGGGIAPITAANLNQLGVGSGSGGGDDIFEFELVNNQAAPADIVDFLVESADNRLFKAEFGISRVYSSPNTEKMTQGSFSGIYRQLGSTWEMGIPIPETIQRCSSA